MLEVQFAVDSSAYKTFIADTLYNLEPWASASSRDDINFSILLSYFETISVTLEAYLDVYEPIVMDYSEFAPLMGLDDFIYWVPEEEDFLFLGFYTKEGKTEFLWDDWLSFMVTKRSGTWMIRAK